jgi:hypothetical protein
MTDGEFGRQAVGHGSDTPGGGFRYLEKPVPLRSTILTHADMGGTMLALAWIVRAGISSAWVLTLHRRR